MLKSHPANIIFFYENTIIINFNFFLLIFFLDPDLFSKVSLSQILLEEFLKFSCSAAAAAPAAAAAAPAAAKEEKKKEEEPEEEDDDMGFGLFD